MKQSIKLLSFSFIAFAMLAFTGTAQAAFNENIAGTDCSVAGIALAGQPLQVGCSNYQDQITATYGQVIDVMLYYRNTSSTDAQNARGSINVVGTSNGYTFTNSITSSVGGAGPKTVYLTLPADADINFNGAKTYQRRRASPMNQTLMAQITNVSGLNSFALGNNGTVESYLKCQTFGDSFCYQGYTVATFTVTKVNTPTQTCTDPTALNYNGALPCTYYTKPQQPQCLVPGAVNYGAYDPCTFPYVPQVQCSINYFNASPAFITQGGNSNLQWSTSNCTSAQIYPTLNSVNLSGSQYVTPASSTVYTLYAYGQNGSPTATTVVTVGAPPVRPVCSDSIDNDGDGKIDINDPGCFDGNVYNPSKQSEYNVVINTQSGPTVSTLAATGITKDTCKLSSIIRINDAALTTGYFKYGTSPNNLVYTTKQDTVGTNSGSYQFADYIQNLAANTTYYYKIVATNSFGSKEGEVRSCKTKSNTVVINEPGDTVTRTVVRNVEVRPITTTVVPQERIIANSAPSLLFLRIDDRREDLTCSDVVDYQVVYKNVSNVVLQNAVLEVELPAGVNYVKSSGGGTYSESTKTVTFTIGTILPSQEDAKFIQADVNCTQIDSNMLVANASMVYTNPSTTAQEEAVAYDLDAFLGLANTNGRTSLTGAAIFGSGFMPNSLVGWLILILVIAGLVYLIRIFLVPMQNNKRTTTKVSRDIHEEETHH